MEQTKNGLTSLTQDALEHSPSHRKCRIIFVESVHRVSVCNLGVLTPMEKYDEIALLHKVGWQPKLPAEKNPSIIQLSVCLTGCGPQCYSPFCHML